MKFNAACYLKRFTLAVAVVALLLAFARGGRCADNLYLVNTFNFELKNINLNEIKAITESLSADEFNCYFTAISTNGLKNNYKIQFIDGAADISSYGFESPAEAFAPKPCRSADLNERQNGVIHKNMVCDGVILFSAPLNVNKKKYHAVIASDWHLYIFSYGTLMAGRSFPLYKTPLNGPPLRALYSDEHIFVLCGDRLTGFRAADAVNERDQRRLAPSHSSLGASEAIKNSIEISTDTINDFDCANRFASSRAIVYKKIALARHIVKSPGESFAYLSMGAGFGNVNIHSVNYNFDFVKLTNFSGAILDFSILDAAAPKFFIKHSAGLLSRDLKSFNSWTLGPPSTLGPSEGAAALEKPGALLQSGPYVASAHKTDGDNYFKITTGVKDNKITLASFSADDETVEIICDFNAHKNLFSNGGFSAPAALSSNPSRPVAFFYDAADGFFRLYDIKNNREYDSFYYNFGAGEVSGVKFSFDNELVMFKVSRYGPQSSKPVSCELYIYRVINRMLMQIAAHRAIDDFDCFRYENKNNIMLIYSREKEYCDSIGILTIE
jgi:hypothetical protein